MRDSPRLVLLSGWSVFVMADTVACTVVYANLWLSLLDEKLEPGSLMIVTVLVLAIKLTVCPQHWFVLHRLHRMRGRKNGSARPSAFGLGVGAFVQGYAVYLVVAILSIGPDRPGQLLELLRVTWLGFDDPVALLKPAALTGSILCVPLLSILIDRVPGSGAPGDSDPAPR